MDAQQGAYAVCSVHMPWGVGVPPGDDVAERILLDPQVPAPALVEEPGVRLLLRCREGQPLVAAGRRAPDRRELGPHVLEGDHLHALLMEFSDVVRRRRMVRNYSSEPVDPAV